MFHDSPLFCPDKSWLGDKYASLVEIIGFNSNQSLEWFGGPGQICRDLLENKKWSDNV